MSKLHEHFVASLQSDFVEPQFSGTTITDAIALVDRYLLAERILKEFTCESEPENGETCGQPATIFDLADERAKCKRCFDRETF